jgi:long-chain acyl-CoA synthetase
MARLIQRIAERQPQRVALTDHRGSTRWEAFNERVNRLISAFGALGLQPGDTISVFAGNCREYYEVMAAAGHTGVLYVPVNWHFTAEELAYVIDNSESKLLITDQEFVAVATAAVARGETPTLEHCWNIGAAMAGFDDYESMLAAGSSAEPTAESMGGPMFYTSGTTGRPKGVRSSTFATGAPLEVMEMIGTGLTGMLSIPADGVTYICGPVYHSAQWAFSFLPLLAGSSVVMSHKFDAAEALQLIDAHAVTNVHLVPTQFHRLLRLDADTKAAFSGASLATVWHGAAPCPPDVKRDMIDWWGPVIHEYYGSTEGSIVTTATASEWLDRPGTLGKPSPMVEIWIVNDDGDRTAANEAGQIYVKNLMGSDFEYHKEPEKTAAAHLEPGVFTFGDIGYLDDDGYLFMSDRKIDMIISGGVNIYPAEIEAVLGTHAAVHDAAVFGIPNEEFGEEVKAAVELREGYLEGTAPTEELAEELIAHCREHLAGYKVPRSIDFVDSMPRHETGKLYKRILRDPYWKDVGRQI